MQLAPRPPSGLALSVERRTTLPGPVELEPSENHRVRVHAGAPARGACGFHQFVYAPGDVDLVPAGFSDQFHQDDASTALMVEFSPRLLRRAADELGRGSEQLGFEPLHQLRDARIEHVAWALDAERSAGYPNGVLYAESLGLALALHLLGGYGAPVRSGRSLSKTQLARVTAYIEEHLDRDLSLATLADVAGMSASHFKTLFRRSTGLPVHEYVVRRRVERAKVLLLQGELAASAVALEAGFSHQSHMARCMRRVLGLTPSALVRGARS